MAVIAKKGTKKGTKKESKSSLREYAKYSTIAFQMLVIILLGVYGGMKLDEWVNGMDFPLFTLIGALVGVSLGIYYAIKDFIKFK